MNNEAAAFIGWALAAFVVAMFSHRGDIAKAVDKSISSKAPAATAMPDYTGTAALAGLAVKSSLTSIDLLASNLDALRRDFDEEQKVAKEDRKKVWETLQSIENKLGGK